MIWYDSWQFCCGCCLVQLVDCLYGSVASTRVQGWGDEPCEPTVPLPDWSELVASYSRMKSAWGCANGGQPILVCYIRKYIIILGGYSSWRPLQPKYWGDVSPASPVGLTPVVWLQADNQRWPGEGFADTVHRASDEGRLWSSGAQHQLKPMAGRIPAQNQGHTNHCTW